MNTQFWSLDTVQTLLRSVLKIGGGYAVARGLADEQAVEAIIAGGIALAAVLWGIAHRNREKVRRVTVTQLPVLVLAAGLVAGCASGNAVAFRTEKVATEAAYAGLLAWKAWYAVALTNTPEAGLPQLRERNEQVYAASRLFAASMTMADGFRERCATNGSAANRRALRLALGTAQRHSSNLVWLVRAYAGQQPQGGWTAMPQEAEEEPK